MSFAPLHVAIAAAMIADVDIVDSNGRLACGPPGSHPPV